MIPVQFERLPPFLCLEPVQKAEQLYDAALNGNEGECQQLVKDGAKVNAGVGYNVSRKCRSYRLSWWLLRFRFVNFLQASKFPSTILCLAWAGTMFGFDGIVSYRYTFVRERFTFWCVHHDNHVHFIWRGVILCAFQDCPQLRSQVTVKSIFPANWYLSAFVNVDEKWCLLHLDSLVCIPGMFGLF